MIVVVSIVLALLFFGPSVCAPSAAAPFEEEEEEEEAHVLAKKFCLIIIVVVVLSFGNAPSGGITKPGFANEAVKYVRALMTIAQRNIVCSDADGNGTEDDDDFSFEFPSVNKRCNVTKCNAHHTTRALVTSCFWWDDDPASRALFFRASHSGPSEHFKTTSRKTDAMTLNCSAFYLKGELNN